MKKIFWQFISIVFLLIGKQEHATAALFPQAKLYMLSGETIRLPSKKPVLIVIGFKKEGLPLFKKWLVSIENDKLIPSYVSLYASVFLEDSFKTIFIKPFYMYALKKEVPKVRYQQTGILVAKVPFVHSEGKSIAVLLIDQEGEILYQTYEGVSASTRLALRKAVMAL